jgi:hypothetical protein
VGEGNMTNNIEKDAWSIDQLVKSKFFHKKMHEWGLIEIARELESMKGEEYEWEPRSNLGISEEAWKIIIHRGLKPIIVFAHPDVLFEKQKRIGYYRMLSMVSQKSMLHIGMNSKSCEEGNGRLDSESCTAIAQQLNRIISELVEFDGKELDPREFDIWRGMAAGSQAQGSWQNVKGEKEEREIRDLIKKRLIEKNAIAKAFENDMSVRTFPLADGRFLVFASDPDVSVYDKEIIQLGLEIKGGIDPAGVLERVGAAIKSLRRVKKENPKATTILIAPDISWTSRADDDVEKNRENVDYRFSSEELKKDPEMRRKLFDIMKI